MTKSSETTASDTQGSQNGSGRRRNKDKSKVPVVAIGASAGGLEAMKEFLTATPNDTGACYVLVQHLDPVHKSILTELLGRCTEMPVRHAEDGQRIAPNQVVIIPPDATLTINSGKLKVERPAPPRSHRTPIDSFLQSVAAEQGDRAIAIILSGTGSDGTQGVKAVNEAGGFTIIQDPKSAKYDSMPRNAAATGLVDQVLAPGEMPSVLIEFLSHIRHDRKKVESPEPRQQLREQLAKICSLLKAETGHDFREYKEPTLLRRIQRRMQVLRLTEMPEYVQRLRDDKQESRQLFRELLVSVTNFFRDPEAFDALDEKVLKPLVENAAEHGTIRVWVPGCATGEEAYSIAMALQTRIEQQGKNLRVQIFATDIDEAALEVARRGNYPDSAGANVPERFLHRYFRAASGEYQIAEEIRELCIFSTQSLIKDPPFSRLDLISCRNVLIYLRAELQNRLIPVFHYALGPDRFLFLGTSETITRQGKLFRAVDAKWRIFRRRETAERPRLQFPLSDLVLSSPTQRRDNAERGDVERRSDQIVTGAERAILDDLGPAYAVVNQNRELIFSGGKIDKFLKLQRGAPSLDIIAIVDPALHMDIRALLHRALADDIEMVRENVSLESDGEGWTRLTLVCRPLGEDASGMRHYLIVFRESGMSKSPGSPGQSADEAGPIQALETELRSTKEYLQTTTEELESSNEELKSANEELMSMNEELQSSNEELESSKEELQSINEELETVNAELASKVEELGRLNADLQNLLQSTQIATLFLDRDLRVRRFTPVAKEIFSLIDSDVGRSIADITSRVEDADVASEARIVLERLAPIERDVTLRGSDSTFIMRLLPYRSPGDVIEGVVATFVDVTRLTKAHEQIDGLNAQLRARVEDLEALLDLVPIGIAFADDPECRAISVNRYGARIMRLPPTTPPVGDPGAGYRFIRDGIELEAAELPLQETWRTGKPVRDFRATYVAPDGASFEFLMSSAPVLDPQGKVRRVIGVYDDVSRLVAAQQAAERRAAQQDFVATVGSLSLHGESADDLIAKLPDELGRILEVDYAKVLRYEPQANHFILEAAFGFDKPDGTVVEGGLNSQAGYTVQSATPVIVKNLKEEKRFNGPPLLVESGVISGVSVLIGDTTKPWGVLGVHTRDERSFTADDVKFLQAVANVIAGIVQRDVWTGHQRLLLDELRHRVKNNLATVQAIATLSFRQQTITPDAVHGFLSRLQSLSRVHDLHVRGDGKDVDFAKLVRQQTEPYDPMGDRIRLNGQSGISVPPSRAIEIAMTIHELVTNAAKHGALSTEAGRVEVEWRSDPRGQDNFVSFEWKETGGPEVKEPETAGIGTNLMRVISRRGDFDVDRRFEPDGFRCRLRVKLDDR